MEVRLNELLRRVPAYEAQIKAIYNLLLKDGEFTPDIILQELEWFYTRLGLDDYYYSTTKESLIAQHIKSLYAAKILARIGGQDAGLQLISENADHAMYACRSIHTEAIKLERRIEERYPLHRLQSYRTGVTDNQGSRIRLYFLSRTDFLSSHADPNETDIHQVASKVFLEVTPASTLERYQAILKKAVATLGPVIEVSDKPENNEKRLMVAYRRDSTHSYFSAISDLLSYYHLHSNRKYVEHFSNGIIIYSIYINDQFDQKSQETLQNVPPRLHKDVLKQASVDLHTLENIVEDASLTYVLPRTSLTPLFQSNLLSAQEVAYAYAAWKFAHVFLRRTTEEYSTLSQVLKESPIHMGLLGRLRNQLQRATFSEGRILDAIRENTALVKDLYADFAQYHADHESPQRPTFNQALSTKIKKTATNEEDQQIFHTFLIFNAHVLRTNFYKGSKLGLAFRLDPSFLKTLEVPEVPFAIYLVVGSEFRGFHIRFRDVARGGIRIIRSANTQVFAHNANTVFEENYNLAFTQQKKNKDIPEGGSKGTILLSLEHQDKGEIAFKKYIDSLLDLLTPDTKIVDYYKQRELLFLGPDEGTADLMDWASQRARHRGYPFWKAFTTGKSVTLGGIPHDRYGMTTRSIHQYVLGILEKQGRREEDISKFQTGGPDGDLGSNEIMISKDKTIGIVDGSGVLYDPQGIDRTEATRLAKARQMVRHFDRKHLSPQGFLVLLEDKDVTLPDGRLVESGLRFRNEFHLLPYSSCDLFVPCGGRPEAVNSNNVKQLFDKEGRPRFRYIVEGANLFLTQDARLALEEAGVVIYKDASANKGGVTSSSLEVLAALSFNDEEFGLHMRVKGDEIPDFYQEYIKEVHHRIEENARLEFECIWREHEKNKVPRSILTDRVSEKINQLNDLIQNSSLWDNEPLRLVILEEACPKGLLQKIGLKALLQRVPENYVRAIFGAHIASRYVYQFGLSAPEFAFFEFIQRYVARLGDQSK